MKLHCPACETLVPAANVDLRIGWGKCSSCDDVFPLAGVLPGYQTPQLAEGVVEVVERPFDAWARLERTPEYLAIHFPAQGMRAAQWGLLGFATSWLAFVAFWTASALGAFWNQGKPPGMDEILFAAFSIPFWLIGFGLLGAIVWKSRGTKSVYMDAQQLLTEWTCLSLRRRRILPRDRVQHARSSTKADRSDDGDSSRRYMTEIVFEKGSFALPCETPSEQKWLVAEINSFLQAVPSRPDTFASSTSNMADEHLRRLKRGDTPQFAT